MPPGNLSSRYGAVNQPPFNLVNQPAFPNAPGPGNLSTTNLKPMGHQNTSDTANSTFGDHRQLERTQEVPYNSRKRFHNVNGNWDNDQKWLTSPKPSTSASGADVNQTMYRPETDGQDMLEMMLDDLRTRRRRMTTLEQVPIRLDCGTTVETGSVSR